MRWCCWSLILFQFLWLNVVIPGHTRGAITIPDTTTGARTIAPADSCCALPAPSPDGADDDRPSPDERRRCAVCYQAAGYTLPPVFNIDLAPVGLSACVHERPTMQVASRHIPLPYFPAGPPADVPAH